MRILKAVVVLILCSFVNAKGLSEYDLKLKLMEKYIKTVRPVANFSHTVQVKFDIALRTIVDLEEKKQILSTSVWIRIYWSDSNLVWDPKNYSNIKTINFRPQDIWTPDVVLYNSADSGGGGILEKSMATNIIANSKGDCSWFCPLILKTECSVDITWFPFDRQVCPYRFGLWTYDGIRANFSLIRDSADIGSYIPSGEWNLEGMKAFREVLTYSCCPNTPYPVVDYKIAIIRRTRFYLLNLIWPGILIAVLASVTFLLPPECGERIGLGITNLLAMTVFLLLISESIPPTSDAVPLAGKFFSVILVLSALALVESCVVIKFLNKSSSDVSHVPRFIKTFCNVYLARMLLIGRAENSSKSIESHQNSNGIDNPAHNGNSRESVKLGSIKLEKRDDQAQKPRGENRAYGSPQPSHVEMQLASGMQEIVSVLKKKEDEDGYKAEWRRAIQVVDRLCTVLFFIILIGSCVGLFVTAPRFYVK